MRRLHNAPLESFYHLFGPGPVDVTPVGQGVIGQRWRSFRHLRQPSSSKGPKEFVIEHQPDVGPLSGQGTSPYPGDYRRAFASSGLLRPHVLQLSLQSACPSMKRWANIRGCRVPLDERAMGEGLVCTPAGVVVSVDLIEQKTYQPAYLFGSSLGQQLELVKRNDACDDSPELTLSHLALAPPRSLLPGSDSSRESSYGFPRVRFRQLHTGRLLPPHVSVGSTG